MPPLIVPTKTIKKLWPSAQHISRLLAEHPGTVFGMISKSGASEKTRTLTSLHNQIHPLTRKVTVVRKEMLIHDPLEETLPTDLILARPIGLISLQKRFAFDTLISRQGRPDDASRRARIQEVEEARVAEVEAGRVKRAERARERAGEV